MLTAGALNGIAIWFRNIINWFRRIWYALNHAVVISAVSEMGTATRGGNLDAEYDFRFSYNGEEKNVKAIEPGRGSDSITSGNTVELFWIPGKKRAMITRYKTDEKSRRAVLICDVVSVIALIIMLVSFFSIGSIGSVSRNGDSGANRMLLIMAGVYGSILVMIIASIIRKKFRRN